MGVTWDSIVNTNRVQCQAQKLEPQTNPRTATNTERAWAAAEPKATTLIEAFDTCRRAFEQSPFTFNNGNTFAAVGRRLVDDCLRSAPPVEAQILRTTIGHYVAGTIDRKELAQVLTHFAALLTPAAEPPPPASAPRRSAEITAPSLA